MRSLRRPIALLLLVWYLPACYAYKPHALTPDLAGREVRVWVADSVAVRPLAVRVKDFMMSGDSVSGRVCEKADPRLPYCTWVQWSVPRMSIRRVETSQLDGQTTAIAITAVAGAAGLLVIVLIAAECSSNNDQFISAC